MDLLMVPVPLFNRDIAVEAYYFRYQKGNDLIEATKPTSAMDGAMRSPLLEAINELGIEAVAMDKPIFVPVNHMMLLTKLEDQCTQPPERIIFLLDNEVPPEEPYISNMIGLKQMGYRFGFQKLPELTKYAPLLEYADFLFVNHREIGQPRQIALLQDYGRNYRYMKLVITHINTMEMFYSLQKNQSVSLFEGRFYRTPLTKGKNKVSPLQANLIKLLNLVRDENFEFDSVATIIQRDTALTISLMRMVNSPYLGLSQKIKTINHAVTMLGQNEVRRWVTTAVSKLLGTDKPDEITKLSLVRGRFAENLSGLFGLKEESQSLFLMGLFSVLDVVLEIPMEEALKMVRVSDPIRDALVNGKGEYYPVYRFIRDYEQSDWQACSRMLILYDLEPTNIYKAFMDALGWYRDLISGELHDEQDGEEAERPRARGRRNGRE